MLKSYLINSEANCMFRLSLINSLSQGYDKRTKVLIVIGIRVSQGELELRVSHKIV